MRLRFPLVAAAVLAVALPSAFARPGDEAPAAPKGPRLVFDRLEHDFGVVSQEQELHAEFQYKNEGDAPLEDLKTLADCGCYGVVLSDLKLPPGGTGTLKLTFRTLLFSGPVTKKLSVKSNDPANPDITIRLKLLVAQGVVLDPGRLWFGDVLVGTLPSKSFTAKWLDGVGRPFQVLGVEVPGHADTFQVDLSPYEDTQRLSEGKEGVWKGTKVTLTFKKPPPAGMFSSTALVRTDHPDHPRLTVPLTAGVSGKVWLQSRTVYFGWVKQGETKRTTIPVRPFSKEVVLGQMKAIARGGRVAVSLEPDTGPGAAKGGWKLVVAVPPGTPPGKIDDVVELHTEVPGEEVIEISVRGEVLPGGR